MESLFGFEGKHILVLGGGRGMGEATSRLLARLGCAVAIADMSLERAERVSSDIHDSGGKAVSICVDVTDDDDLITAIERADKTLGPLNGMATVIGMAHWAPILESSIGDWDADHRRNLRYFYLAAREVARSLLARKAAGSIVCVASVDGIHSSPNHAAYGAAKAGLINLVKSMAGEWSGRGIRVNCVAPGPIVTPRLPLTDERKERESLALIPMQRRGTVQDIANAVAFFLSDLTPFITGQTLAVDGGYGAAVPLLIRETELRGVQGADLK
jgi:NAD(P)-dependent dehydrogenase (short-subunit alcohol dehydrogenase family)